MNILITGASGFIGRTLSRRLRAGGHTVRALSSRECDMTGANSLDALEHADYDRIYHLAVWTRAGDFCRTHGGEQWVINSRINTNMLDWWRRAQPQAKLIAFGTSVSYARTDDLREAFYMDGDPLGDYYAYAMSKRMLLAGLRTLSAQFRLRYSYIVPSTVYGPGYHTDGRQLHFIYDLIRKILRGKAYGEPVTLWGDGYQRRELIYIDDFVKVLEQVPDVLHNDIVNLGAGADNSIRDFAVAICDIVGFDAATIQYDTAAHVGAKSKVLNVSRLRALLPNLTFTPLHDGLVHTIAWMQREREYFLKEAGA
jgi:GDP-L-fucose synthase